MKHLTKMQRVTICLLLAYAVYEFYFIAKWNETNIGAPIRVDLLLFYPTLLGLTLSSLYQAWKRKTVRVGALIALLFLATIGLNIYLMTQPAP